jgi:hypothetical protein
MAGVTRIPRRRGSLCGGLLVLLGAWGALGPLVGPYFTFAYSPDRTWFYSQGRLYLSILPGAAAVVGGLLVLATRSRAAGMLGGLLAAAGGAWLIAGQGIVTTLLSRPSITAGVPVTRDGAVLTGQPLTSWQFLEMLALFTGVGILIVFLGALAAGRFSMVSARDTVAEDEYGDDYLDPADDGQPGAVPADQYAATTTHAFPGAPRPFPGEEPTDTQDRFPAATTGQFPSPTGQFPSSAATQTQFPQTRGPFEPGSSSE